MESNSPILIFECANSHGGDFDILKSTIETFKDINYPVKHIKFQAFQPETLALEDFSWYQVYKDLIFSNTEWREIIELADQYYDGIWLDIFEIFGVKVLEQNRSKIFGVKLQASVLENDEVISLLKKKDLLKDKALILNVSGFEINEIESFLEVFSELRMNELILQIGHQAYPTQLKDTGLQKVAILKKHFPNHKICIADHAEATDDFSCIVPLLGVASGCEIIEKHICLDRKLAKYDFYSALEFHEMQLLANRIQSSLDILNGSFISESESEYLSKSVQIPIANKLLPKGSLISKSDIIYRRTAQTGNTNAQLLKLQKEYHILKEDIGENSSLNESQFHTANIGVIVACRMKSSRLKTKALLPINGVSSIDRCLQNCLKIKEANIVVLATSTEDEDSILQHNTLDGKVKFWQGDPNDVIQRYLGACNKYNIEVVVRVTGDCPVVSTEIASYLLEHHFATGADFTSAKNFAVGSACEIYNVEALQRVINYVGKANYSEYMTWYMQNNSDIFKVENVDLPEQLVRDYRLTLDYPEDLELFDQLFHKLEELDKEPTLLNIFDVLDSNPQIAKLNSELTLVYKTDTQLIEKLNKETRINLNKN